MQRPTSHNIPKAQQKYINIKNIINGIGMKRKNKKRETGRWWKRT